MPGDISACQTRASETRARAILIAMLAAVTSLSQFFRASGGVIAPELIRDLGLSPEQLGLASGAFFIALGIAQVPVGMMFDRIGARRTVAALSAVTVVGALLHAVVGSGATLVAARAVLGLGNAASFMSVIVLCARWFPGERLATVLSWIFAFSQAGILLAATPLAVLTQTIGWRWTFVGAAALTAAVAVAFHAAVRDDPPGATPHARPRETLVDLLRGVVAILRIPDIAKVLAIHTVAYASMITVLGLWAAPYLADVHGLDPVACGNVLLAMGVAQAAGVLAVGPLDRRFNTRKWIVVAFAAATIAVLLALALIARPPTALAVALLVGLCAVASYSVVIVAHGRSLFPDELAGRGVTTVNLAQVAGSALLPIATGWILGGFALAPGHYPEAGYRLVFAVIAAVLGLGLLVYLRARDVKPRAQAEPGPGPAGERGVVVTFSGARSMVVDVDPGRAGRNTIILAFSTGGAAFRPREVRIELAQPDAGIEPIVRAGTPAGDGRFQLAGLELALPGTWTLRVEALIDDFEKAIFATRIVIR